MQLIHSADLALHPVSHNPDILKKVILPSGIIPTLMQFAQTTFQPGQVAPSHSHTDMYEVFFIQSGRMEYLVDEVRFEASAGDCIVVEPGEQHELLNVSQEPVSMIYFGISSSQQQE